MNKNELRIGNLVNHKIVWSHRNGAAHREFCFEWSESDWYAIGECTLNFEECIEPIPLTEEWLVKFGFEKVVYDSEETGYGTEYELKCSSDVFMVYEDDFSVALYSCKEVIGRDLSVIPTWNQVKTVHGLQNLYHALTGEELKLIEL